MSGDGLLQAHANVPTLPLLHDSERPRTSEGAPEAPAARKWLHDLRRPKSSQSLKPSTLRKRRLPFPREDVRRDSALVSSSPTASADSTVHDENSSVQRRSLPPSRLAEAPAIVVHQDQPATENTPFEPSERRYGESSSPNANSHFHAITTDIPTGGFEGLTSPDKLQFSNRGTMLLDGEKVTQFFNSHSPPEDEVQANPTSRPRVPPARSTRVLSVEDVTLSRRVRSMYECGGESTMDLTGETVAEEDEESDKSSPEPDLTVRQNGTSTPIIFNRQRQSLFVRQPYETAGGIEDWEDIAGGEVDRYGFIIPKTDSRGSNRSTSALATPRKNYADYRSPSRAESSPSAVITGKARSKLQKSPKSIYSYRTNQSYSQAAGKLRYAANRLPHNRNRRWMDEAGDMLTPPPGLAELAELADDGRAALAMKKKEWKREDKWKKMGRKTQRSTKGGGMLFDFDARDPKVVSRTWKGIPDKWRASAWYSFLAASTKKQKNPPSDEELVEAFHELQEENSADDMQIDCDVPRTISSHIMFRRRYRGGQRLLFRVLHALSLYFPETGYVQGMAAIVATLLCYYDEEHAFIMTVRLWQLRGMERLYQPGFGGLMEALEEFQKQWLRSGEVAKKLVRSGRDASFRVPRNDQTATNECTGRASHRADRLRHPLVSHLVQLLDPVPRSAPRLGCVYAPRRHIQRPEPG